MTETLSSTSRARVRKAPSERGAEIVAAAVAIAREQGLSAITLRAVAGRADVASGLITHYEPSIELLIARAFREIVTVELRELVELVSRYRNAAEQMRALILATLGGGDEDITVVWVEAYALGRRNEALAHEVRSQMRAWTGFVARIIRNGQSEGSFNVSNPIDSAWQILGMLDGLNAQALVRQTDALPYVTHMTQASEALLGARPGTLGS